MMTRERPAVVAIVGPTASGKTGLAIDLANRFSGEVISADSRQVYRDLDIGTAKVTEAETQGIPHHLIDIVSLPNIYTANDFVRDATVAISSVTGRGNLPIIAGGTFFYLDLLFGKSQAAPVAPNQKLREQLAGYDTKQLLEQLEVLDPDRAASIDPHNPRRLVRAIEIAATLGKNPAPENPTNPYRTLILGVDRDREELRARFATRADKWLKAGIIEETQALLDNDITRDRIQELGFEYTLVLQLIDNEISVEEWRERFVQKNWQYAKRQLTWLRRDTDICWINPREPEAVHGVVQDFLATE